MLSAEPELLGIACRVSSRTASAWLDAVRSDFGAFLRDHAACERKASATAMTLASHYPDRGELVRAMVDLACEELGHFRRVFEVIVARGGTLGTDTKDLYVGRMLGLVRRGREPYLLDRLLVAGAVEARGCERFRILGESLGGDMGELYRDLAASEANHARLFVRLARTYFPAGEVAARLGEIVDREAEIIATLPVRPALH